MAIDTEVKRFAALADLAPLILPDGAAGASDRAYLVGQYNTADLVINLSESLSTSDVLAKATEQNLTEVLFFSDATFVTITIDKMLEDSVTLTDWLTVTKSRPSSTFTEL